MRDPALLTVCKYWRLCCRCLTRPRKASRKRWRWIRYAAHWSNLGNACSLYILATLLQVPDGVMAAYESQSEEEETDEICGNPTLLTACI
jgi:hypothetical protein